MTTTTCNTAPSTNTILRVARLHARGCQLPQTVPYIQDVTDHSALIVWRRKCIMHEEEGINPFETSTWTQEDWHLRQPQMEICFSEVGMPKERCQFVFPQEVEAFRDNFPDCQYMVRLDNLGPSGILCHGGLVADGPCHRA